MINHMGYVNRLALSYASIIDPAFHSPISARSMHGCTFGNAMQPTGRIENDIGGFLYREK